MHLLSARQLFAKDLPGALRSAGRWVRKARLLTREFQHSVDEMIRQAELEDLRDQLIDVFREDRRDTLPPGTAAAALYSAVE